MVNRKRGWTSVTSGRLYELYAEVMDRARELGLWTGNNPPLFTKKSVKVLGCCFSEKNADGTYDSAIVINEILLKYSDDQIRHTLVHEVVHAMHPRLAHSAIWKKDANLLGQKWGLKIGAHGGYDEINKEILNLKRAKRHYKYEVYCPHCGKSWQYERICPTVKNPHKYRCPTDNSPLKSRKINIYM